MKPVSKHNAETNEKRGKSWSRPYKISEWLMFTEQKLRCVFGKMPCTE